MRRWPLAVAILALLAAGCDGRAKEDAPDPRESPRRQIRIEAGVSDLAAGGGTSFAPYSHTCAVADGALQCWGANGAGQIGDGFVSRRVAAPVRVVGLESGVSRVAAGRAHTCAIADGSVLCWGMNDRRQLGFEKEGVTPTPTRVAGLPVPATELAAGGDRTCAVAGERVFCWGGRSAPAAVAGIDGAVRAVALGGDHACASTREDVFCWDPNAPPARVAGLPAPATQLAAGGDRTCAVAGERLFCWAVGAEPAPVEGLAGAVREVALGQDHACASTQNGVFCWGANDRGQLGDGSTSDRATPVAVKGQGGGVTALAAGVDQTCAARDGGVFCWGGNGHGQLGRGRVSQMSEPGPVSAWDGPRVRDRDGDGRLTVVCLGDSNTERGFRTENTWCERLAALFPDDTWAAVNRGWAGAVASPRGGLRTAAEQLAYTLELDAPDAVILAYGTNDVLAGTDAAEIVLAYEGLRVRAREDGVAAWVALTPPAKPRHGDVDDEIEALNALIRRTIPSDRIVDFHDTVSPADLPDGIHLNDAGQAARARAALSALGLAGPAR